MIPKQIFQTWHTKELDPVLKAHVDGIKARNPTYTHFLYDDADMDHFVNTHFPGEIADCYNRLNLIVAKADLWRYLILYKYGGVYLDMDSDIVKPLDELIKSEDEAILTFENNHHRYLVQWALIFRAGHPLLKATIDRVIENIRTNRYPNNIHATTGPQPFTEAFLAQSTLNPHSLQQGETVYTPSARIFGLDYCGYFNFCRHDVKVAMYKEKEHWQSEQTRRPLLKDAV